MYSDVGDELCNAEVQYVRELFIKSVEVLIEDNNTVINIDYKKLYELWDTVPESIKSDWFSTLWDFDIRNYEATNPKLGHPEHRYELFIVIYNLSQRVLEKIKEYITTDEFQDLLTEANVVLRQGL